MQRSHVFIYFFQSTMLCLGISSESRAETSRAKENFKSQLTTESMAASPDSAKSPLTVEVSAFTRLEMRQGYRRLGLVSAREGGALTQELADYDLPAPYWARFQLPEKYWRRFSEGELQASRARLAVQSAEIPAFNGTNVQFRISPQMTALWRDPTQGKSETALDVYEGYVRLNGRTARATAGRFAMNYGEGLVIGNLGWHESGRAFDGVHTRLELTKGYVDTFATTEAQNKEHLGVFAGGDRLFWGTYSNLGAYLTERLELEPYVLGRTIPGDVWKTLLTLGLRIKQTFEWFDYRLESDIQLGRTDMPGEVRAYQTEGEFGFGQASRVRVGLGGAIASAEDPDTPDLQEGFMDLYPTGHKFLGLSDVFGPRRNAFAGFANLNVALTPRIDLMATGHAFHRLHTPRGAAYFAGVELDTQFSIRLGKHSSLRALYAVFVPNDDHYRPEVDGFKWGQPAHFFECQVGIEF